MHLDNSWNKLRTLSEYIDDTEDFISIELDSHRNQLTAIDLVGLDSILGCLKLGRLAGFTDAVVRRLGRC